MDNAIDDFSQHLFGLEFGFGALLEKVTVDDDLKRFLKGEVRPIELDMFFVRSCPFDPHIIMLNSDFEYLRVTHEELSSTFRTNKRKVEKELNFALSHMKNMHNNIESLDRTQSLATLQGISSRLVSFKEQLLDMYTEEDKVIHNYEARIASLQSPNEPQKMLRLITEHYSRQENFQLAEAISEVGDLKAITDINIFQKAKKIKDDLATKELVSALDWCDSHKSKLKRLNSPLEFQLKLQKFIEFIRVENNCAGILYARTHLSKYPEHQEDLQKALMLLITFQKKSGFDEYHSLLDESRWAQLIDLFGREHLRVYSYPNESSLKILMRAGLVALKNYLCESDSKVQECPLCNQEFQRLAEKVPYACHLHSRIVCRILHIVMDENNPPMALPNGQTFSEQGLKKITKGNKVTCPVTGAVFSTSQISKLYIV